MAIHPRHRYGLEFDQALLEKYDRAGPRYTSYPTAVEFTPDFDAGSFRRQTVLSNAGNRLRPLSLYFHIPFCDTVCYYCACNKIVTKNRKHAADYLRRLHREIQMMGYLFPRERVVTQLHWGGGTPTFLSTQQMVDLMGHSRRNFTLLDNDEGEYGIEIDPRALEADTLDTLRDIGFNRLSMGVQDLDPQVQAAVNRIQPAELTFSTLVRARALKFKSVSLDLIYGLPLQTPESFSKTLQLVIDAQPDRLSIFNYAHLPQRFKVQRQINEEDLPSAETKLAILRASIEGLLDAGYVYIGMDHFARKEDDLSLALENGSLYRNFQGYATHADCELVAMGTSAISRVGDCYAQNAHDLEDYYRLIDSSQLAIQRGVVLTRDDLIRRDVINQLMCQFAIDFDAIEKAHGIEFEEYFDVELKNLEAMMADGLMTSGDRQLLVTPKGRLLIRNISMVFDAYRQIDGDGQRFSKVI
ncbi:MAG: oxygen-independent coproporphyrinogen III oxidase [Gammaproteobacteria bacterium]|nr:oxygen-independent coproporphyrinogen III oxidase [Gammaproteobacteria bacterium]